ncbi:MAG TPA: drug/metabolite exporter YedA [Chloroflexia bacterium]|nr:drug/metabolite exporter YedA [Chloroflexia bacterium]
MQRVEQVEAIAQAETEQTALSANKASSLKIGLALVTLYFIWGSTYLGMRLAIESFPPFFMAAVRFLIAGSLLYGFLRMRGMSNPTRKQWGSAALVGGLLLICGNTGVAFAEQWIDSGLAAVMVATVPLWTALFAGFWGRWPRRQEWIGSGLGLIGVILLSTSSRLQLNPLGLIIVLGGAVCWAFGSVWSKHLPMPPGLMASAAEMLCAGAILLIVSLLTGTAAPTGFSLESVGALIYLIIFGSLIAFSAFSYLIRTVRPTLATSYAYVNPLVAVGLGALLASEQITWLEVIAMFFVISGVAFVSLSQRGQSK